MPRTYVHSDHAFHLYLEDGLQIVTWTTQPTVSDEAFERHLSELCGWYEQGESLDAALTCSTTFTPTSKQRAIIRAYEARIPKTLKAVAALSNSAMVRGAMTAISWFAPFRYELKAFASRDHQRAFGWLKACGGRFDEGRALANLLAANQLLNNSPLG